MNDDTIRVVGEFPRRVREIENTFIPLADGVQLAARIWLPEDAETKPVPAILEFLPYRKRDGTAERDELTHPYYAGHGYACVRVDMRGSGESDGILEDEYLKSEQDNALEVLDWITAQVWCSGNTGIIGISWGGFNGLQIAARKPPSLKAIVTICSTDDRYADDIHYMGGVMLKDNLTWGACMFAFNARPPDPAIVGDRWRDLWMNRLRANDPWVTQWLDHQARDAFWQHGSVCENYSDIDCAVYAVGGWADGYSNAVPRLLEGLKGPVKGLIGPWAHKYPHFALPGPRIDFLNETLRWWDYWLKGIDTGIADEPKYRVWMQASAPPRTHYLNRPGRWVAEADWPSPDIQPLQLWLSQNRLSETKNDCEDQLVQTPLSLGAHQGAWCGHGVNPDAPNDQREEDGCSVIFETKPLSETIDILGAPVLNLRIAADQPDAFVVARLCDVAPDGASTRVSFGVLNLTHRDSHEEPEALTPGVFYSLKLQLNDTAQSFAPGHRIRLSVSNSFWPMLWPSPQHVALTLNTHNCSLTLPTRPESAADDQLPRFNGPESAPPQRAQALEDPDYTRLVEKDETNGDTRMTVIDNHGMTKLTRLNWDHGSTSRHYSSINDSDPNSARLHAHWSTHHRRTDFDMDVRVETYSTLTSTATEFIVEAKLEAFESESMVYSNNWNRRYRRFHN